MVVPSTGIEMNAFSSLRCLYSSDREMALESVLYNGVDLICRLQKTKLESGRRVVIDDQAAIIEVRFGYPTAHLVIEEVMAVTRGIGAAKSSDVVFEIDGKLMESFLDFRGLYPSAVLKSYVVVTSHDVICVVAATDPIFTLDKASGTGTAA